MARPTDISSQHFDWLVESRSRNQRSTASLYALIEDHVDWFKEEVTSQLLAQELAAVAFSLWRAVFLSDLDGSLGGQFADLKTFLRSLIAYNAVLYQTDYNAREWAFTYYLGNATMRLEKMAAVAPNYILNPENLAQPAETAKDDWTNAQTALETAIANFAQLIANHDQR